MTIPHVILGQTLIAQIIVAVALLNGMIRKMHGFVEIDQREFLGAESQVGLAVHPDDERLDAGHEEPLANVKLAVVNDKRSFCGRYLWL